MIRIETERRDLAAYRNVALQVDNAIERSVDEILFNVRERGDKALLEYTERFDRVSLSALRVTEQEIDAAVEALDPFLLETIARAARNIESYHRRQIQNGYQIQDEPGIVLGQIIRPIEKVGIYVPGGTASYPSTVLMDVIPAKLAGVERIVMTTPPNAEGKVMSAILAAARIAGVTEIYKVGGAQAIGALAYGTETVPAVDKIVGPGNVYVATAKRRVFGIVDIEMIAGPSEILIIADGMSNPAHVAADLLSQAEHDVYASAVLVTDSMELAEAVAQELERQIPSLERADIARRSIDENGRILVTGDLIEAMEIANSIAPEHLELCVEEPFALLGRVKNAGSVFLGRYTPEPLGDYWAGANHTLPTSGTARFASPLNVADFVKKTSYIYYTKDALREARDHVECFAGSEGLTAHARSVAIRFAEEKAPFTRGQPMSAPEEGE